MRADWFAPRYLFGDDLRRDILALPLKRQNGFADLILHLSDEVIAGVRVSGELVPNLSVSKKALSIELPQSFIKSSVACFAAIKESRSSLLVGSFFSNHRSVEIPSESHSISEISHAGGGAPANRRQPWCLPQSQMRSLMRPAREFAQCRSKPQNYYRS